MTKKKHNSTNKKTPFLTNKCRYQTKTNSRKQSTRSNRINKQNHVLSTISMMMDDVIMVEKKTMHARMRWTDGRTDIRCYVMRRMREQDDTQKKETKTKRKRETEPIKKKKLMFCTSSAIRTIHQFQNIQEKKRNMRLLRSFVRSFVLPVRQRTCEQKTKHNHHPRQ